MSDLPLSLESMPTPLPLCIYGDPVLRRKALPVTAVTPELAEFAGRMAETMYANRGIGLAAPQVGRNLRLVVLDTRISAGKAEPPAAAASPGERLLLPRMPVALVNPQILAASAETEIGSEGCLSVPKLYADVERAVTVLLEATLLDGTPLLVQCGGLLARCLQHEVDHLDGILFPDRAAVGERTALAGKLDAMERRTLKALAKSRQVM